MISNEAKLKLFELMDGVKVTEPCGAVTELVKGDLAWWHCGRYRASCKGSAVASAHGYTGSVEHVRALPRGSFSRMSLLHGNPSADKRAGA